MEQVQNESEALSTRIDNADRAGGLRAAGKELTDAINNSNRKMSRK